MFHLILLENSITLLTVAHLVDTFSTIAPFWAGNVILLALSRESGLASSTLANTLLRHWPKGERLIAQVMSVDPLET